ncbi:MAG: hypothetical protein ACLSAP_08575 [Oscillospiraceae bacterium]
MPAGGKAIATTGVLLGLVNTPAGLVSCRRDGFLTCIAAVHPHRLRVIAAFALFGLLACCWCPNRDTGVCRPVSALVIRKHLPRPAGETLQVAFFPYARRRHEKIAPLCKAERHGGAPRRDPEKTAR